MKKKLTAAVAAVCSAALALSMVGCGGGMRFVTGGESGTYYAYGTVLAQYATNTTETNVNALASEGSKANVDALKNADAELAFCQGDVAAYAYQGTKLFAEDGAFTDFSVVASLYQEQVQIVTCNPNIKSVADLAGKTVSVGAANSGVYFNAVDVLNAYGIDAETGINAVYQNFADSTDSLKNGKVDAAFIVAGAPTTAITDLATTNAAYLVSMDDEHIAKLVKSSPYYTEITIKGGTYTTQTEDVKGVAVDALVLASSYLSEDAIYEFTKSIFEGAKEQPDAHAKYEDLDVNKAAAYTSVAYHPGAAKYYAEQGIEVTAAE